jgi:hypothetical protein
VTAFPLVTVAGPLFATERFATGVTLSVAVAWAMLEPALVVRAPAGIVFT